MSLFVSGLLISRKRQFDRNIVPSKMPMAVHVADSRNAIEE
jgi:hypothetical protein